MKVIEHVNELIVELGLSEVIPKLKTADFCIKSKAGNRKEIEDIANEGWFLYSDKFVRGNLEKNQDNLLEAQWYDNQNKHSGSAQLLGNNQYQITTIKQGEGENFVYQEIKVTTQETSHDKYQILWQCNDKGKYSVKAQAYLGSKSTTLQENT